MKKLYLVVICVCAGSRIFGSEIPDEITPKADGIISLPASSQQPTPDAKFLSDAMQLRQAKLKELEKAEGINPSDLENDPGYVE